MTEQAIADARIQIRLGLAQIMVVPVPPFALCCESHLPRAVQTPLDKGLFEGTTFARASMIPCSDMSRSRHPLKGPATGVSAFH